MNWAMYQIETPLDEVMNAEMISYPNTKLMCSVNVDGSAAAVLVSLKKKQKNWEWQEQLRLELLLWQVIHILIEICTSM